MLTPATFEGDRALGAEDAPIPGRSVLEQMLDPVACCELDGTLVYANPAAGRVYGCAPQEMRGRKIWQHFGDEAAGALRSVFERLDGSGSFESYHAPSGSWLQNSVFQAEGRVWVVGQDVTEGKLSAARVEILAGASRALSEATPDVGTLFDTMARLVAELTNDGASIRLLSEDGQTFESPVGAWDPDPEVLRFLKEAPALRTAEGAGAHLLQTGTPLVLAGMEPSLLARRISSPERWDAVAGLGIHSIVVAPLKTQGRIIGMVSVFRRESVSTRPHERADVQLVEDLAGRAALVVNQWRTLRLAEESRQSLALIGDAVPALISLVDRNGRYRFVNAAYERWFDCDRASLLGRTVEEVLGPATWANIAPQSRRALSGETVTFQTPIEGPTGVRHTQVTYTPQIVGGEVEGFVALVVDETDKVQLAEERERLLAREHQAREVAERREERLRYVVENSPYAVAMLDRDLRYLFASRRWLGDFDIALTKEQIRGRGHYDLLPEIPKHWSEVYKRALAGETIRREAEAFPRADGTVDWIHWEVRPWTDDRGQVGGILIFSEDINEQRRSAEELKAAVAARDEFLSIASHELRTPLTALELQLGWLERMLRDGATGDGILPRMETAIRQADRLARLVEGLFNVSQIQSGSFRLEPEDVDLVSLVREVVEQLGDQAGRVGCELEVRCPPELEGRWDKGRLQQALTNLLANAFKYAPGKPVTIQLEGDEEGVRLSVEDRGIGISAHDQTRIFGRFERAVPSRHYGGLGLGLYVTQQIAHAHGGSVAVESELGKGSIFTLHLPRLAPAP